MTTDQVINTIGLIGIGTLLSGILNYITQLLKSKADSKHSLKETRYKAIILLCYAYVNYEKEQSRLKEKRPDITTLNELYEELVVEWTNMALYGSDKVIFKMKEFLEKKDKLSYNELIITMRKDLYGIRSKLQAADFTLKN